MSLFLTFHCECVRDTKTQRLTELLRPFDGGARVCGVALSQVNDLGADLPAHHRIETCRGGAPSSGCVRTVQIDALLTLNATSRPHSTCQRRVWFAPGVDVHERARSHGDLHVSGVEAALSEHCRLLVSHLRRDKAAAELRDHWVFIY